MAVEAYGEGARSKATRARDFAARIASRTADAETSAYNEDVQRTEIGSMSYPQQGCGWTVHILDDHFACALSVHCTEPRP